MNVRLLKEKDFSLLMLGKLVSLIGTEMQSFALSLYVLKITGSASKFASVLAITLIPKLILGPIAGVFVDWFDKKKILVYLDMAQGVITGIYAVVFMINGKLSLGSIYILVILLSLTSVIFQPAVGTVIPSITKKEDLVDANGINSVILNLGGLAAPALGGFLFGFYGLFVILVLNCISFILSSICEMFINIPKSNKAPEKISFKSFSEDFSEGIKFIKDKRIILNIMVMALVTNFTCDPVFSIGLTYISKKILKVTDVQFGMVEAAFVLAMIIAPFIVSKVSKKIKMGKLVFLDVFITSILIGVMAIIPSSIYLRLFHSNVIPYISLLIVVFMIGLITSIGNIAIFTMLQQEVPLSMLGRVGTVMTTLCMAAMPLSRMIFGVLFDKIPAWTCIAICAGMTMIAILAFKKSLYRNDKKDRMETYNDEMESKVSGID